jgi:glycosyltransferase involved in cell wall biosynthesis
LQIINAIHKSLRYDTPFSSYSFSGMVVSPRNHGALCEAWLKLIELGSAKRRGLGEKARKRIEDHFSIQMIARKYEQLYEEQVH